MLSIPLSCLKGVGHTKMKLCPFTTNCKRQRRPRWCFVIHETILEFHRGKESHQWVLVASKHFKGEKNEKLPPCCLCGVIQVSGCTPFVWSTPRFQWKDPPSPHSLKLQACRWLFADRKVFGYVHAFVINSIASRLTPKCPSAIYLFFHCHPQPTHCTFCTCTVPSRSNQDVAAK